MAGPNFSTWRPGRPDSLRLLAPRRQRLQGFGREGDDAGIEVVVRRPQATRRLRDPSPYVLASELLEEPDARTGARLVVRLCGMEA